MVIQEISKNCFTCELSSPSTPILQYSSELTTVAAALSPTQVVEDLPVTIPGANGEMEEIVSLLSFFGALWWCDRGTAEPPGGGASRVLIAPFKARRWR